MSTRACGCIALLTSIFCQASKTPLEAATIGPGSSSVLTHGPVHSITSEASLEISREAVELAGGMYRVESFSFHNVTLKASPDVPGFIVPFLAILTEAGDRDGFPPEATRAYETIWVGASVPVNNVADVESPNNVVTTNYAAGSQQFSIPAATDIYAGFYTVGTARVAWNQMWPYLASPLSRVDHDTEFPVLTHAGEAIASLSNPFYNAFYAFHIDVEPADSLPLVPGDFDGDRDVDGADFVIWQTNFPSASGRTLATGDADGDGDVDGADFVIWQTNFPFTPNPAVSPVPEPPSVILLFVTGVLVVALEHKTMRHG